MSTGTPTVSQKQLQTIDFKTQYNSNYMARYAEMKEFILDQEGIPTKTVSSATKEECMIKGVLFIKSKLKMSVFEKSTVLNFNTTPENISTYVDTDMQYFVEDDGCKCELVFKCTLRNDFLITGMVLGFVGTFIGGIFECTRIIFPETVNGSCSGCKSVEDKEAKHKMLVFSNIKINKNYEKILPLLDIYKDEIDDIILIGSIFDTHLEAWDFSRFERVFKEFKGNVYIVPGKDDPTTDYVPQSKIHKLLFVDTENIKTLPNPGKVEIKERHFVFYDYNLIIKDFLRYKTNSTPIDALKAIVKCRHLAPCAPDTLPSIPFVGKDPFILHSCEFMICGGTKTDSTMFRDKFLLSVPDFNETCTAVLLNTKTRGVQEIELKTQF